MKIPPRKPKTIDALLSFYEKKERDIRYKLGASDIGDSSFGGCCERALFYRFRWFAFKQLNGRERRLLETGHREEKRLIQDLRNIGIKIVSEEKGKQIILTTACDGHFETHSDFIILEGLLEAPNKMHDGECKTVNVEDFIELTTKGIQEKFPDYYDQIVVRIGGEYNGQSVERGYFIAYNKNEKFLAKKRLDLSERNKEVLHSERIHTDPERKHFLLDRARRVIFETNPLGLARVSDDPNFFKCRFCEAQSVCHKLTTDIPHNCRTCQFSKPIENAKWYCSLYKKELSDKFQLSGCDTGYKIIEGIN